MNYYNEFDPKIAAWLRQLIADGHIPAGEVDERSIEDVLPSDLAGFTQCHFFAGIGGWSHALDLAGWPRDQRVWTGSCPCQPFSAAGKGDGFADERHLWPAWQHLIAQCRPAIVFGEQVASKAADVWIDLVHADMENLGYAFGCIPFPSAGIGAPHIRDRTYWVADAAVHGRDWAEERGSSSPREEDRRVLQPEGRSAIGRLAHTEHDGHNRAFRLEAQPHCDESNEWISNRDSAAGGMADAEGRGRSRELLRAGSGLPKDGVAKDGGACGMADADSNGRGARQRDDQVARHGDSTAAAGFYDRPESTGPLHGFWRNADWLLCTDGKWRPVEPDSFPLVDCLPRSMVRGGNEGESFHPAEARAMRLKGYGNAINPHQAAEFICAAVEAIA